LRTLFYVSQPRAAVCHSEAAVRVEESSQFPGCCAAIGCALPWLPRQRELSPKVTEGEKMFRFSVFLDKKSNFSVFSPPVFCFAKASPLVRGGLWCADPSAPLCSAQDDSIFDGACSLATLNARVILRQPCGSKNLRSFYALCSNWVRSSLAPSLGELSPKVTERVSPYLRGKLELAK